MNNTTQPEKTTNPVGQRGPMSTINTVQLVQCATNVSVQFNHGVEFGYDLEPENAVNLKQPIVAEEPFGITMIIAPASSIPPLLLKLNDNGDVVLTEDASDAGWEVTDTNVFIHSDHSILRTSVVVTGTGPGPEPQQIIIVGTVPFPEKP